jgi:hypothetical protein
MSEPRTSDGLRDIGAYETQNVLPPDLVIATSSLPGSTVGVSYTTTLAASGGITPYLWSIATGGPPPGLSLNSQTGAISGTPSSAGTFTFTAQVSDAQNPPDRATKSLSITVSQPAPPNITTTSLPSGKRNKSYSQTLRATGGITPYTWSVAAGSLPPGLALNASTGVISGKPTTLGKYNFTVRVRDSQPTPASDTQALSITVTR